MPKFLVLMVAVLFFITSIYIEGNFSEKKIEDSIQKGQECLVKIYNETHFYNDPYIYCEYPEKIYDGCDPIYRKLDIATNLIWIDERVKNHEVISSQIQEAILFTDNLEKEWENEEIGYGYFGIPKYGVGFDSFCILALLKNNKKMEEKVKADLKNYIWVNLSLNPICECKRLKLNETCEIPEKNIRCPLFRKNVDETWCISLLAQFKEDENLIQELTRRKLSEGMEYVASNEYDDYRKAYVMIHLLLMFNELREYGYNISAYEEEIYKVEEMLVNITKNETLVAENNAQANALYSLILMEYKNRKDLEEMADLLIKRQKSDGCWLSYGRSTEYKDFFRSFTTLHAIQALNEYELIT